MVYLSKDLGNFQASIQLREKQMFCAYFNTSGAWCYMWFSELCKLVHKLSSVHICMWKIGHLQFQQLNMRQQIIYFRYFYHSLICLYSFLDSKKKGCAPLRPNKTMKVNSPKSSHIMCCMIDLSCRIMCLENAA